MPVTAAAATGAEEVAAPVVIGGRRELPVDEALAEKLTAGARVQ